VLHAHLRREGIVVAHLDDAGEVGLHLPANQVRGLLRRPPRPSATAQGEIVLVAKDLDQGGPFVHVFLLEGFSNLAKESGSARGHPAPG
jgi:hypothetical protein